MANPLLRGNPMHRASKLAVAAFALLAAAAPAAIGCTAATGGSDAIPTRTDGALVTTTKTDSAIVGHYSVGGESVSFEAHARPNDVFEVDIEVHGLTLDATIDRANHTSSFDGFATDNGRDSQVLEADRALVAQLAKKLGEEVGNTTAIGDALQASASVWGDTTSTVKLNRRVMGEEGRGWTSLCGQLHQVVGATHDCWSYSNWDSNSSQNAYVGYATGSTYYWRNGWSTSSYDHASWPYEYGNCFGQCGPGCGNAQRYTQDCHNHDGCVRNGHSIASLWCDDELTAASDDFLFAPNCNAD